MERNYLTNVLAPKPRLYFLFALASCVVVPFFAAGGVLTALLGHAAWQDLKKAPPSSSKRKPWLVLILVWGYIGAMVAAIGELSKPSQSVAANQGGLGDTLKGLVTSGWGVLTEDHPTVGWILALALTLTVGRWLIRWFISTSKLCEQLTILQKQQMELTAKVDDLSRRIQP